MKRISFLTAFCLFVPLFADEGLWVDNLRGSDANTGTRTAPFATIERACALVKKSQKITVVNTGKPYSLPYSGFDKARGLRLTRGGTADRPQIVEGNGAVISGFAVIPAAHWSQESGKTNIFSLLFWPMVNSYKNPSSAPNFWPDGTPIWFVDNVAAPNCHSLAELEKTPGGFWWNKKEKRVLFALPAGKKLNDLKIELPANYGFYLQADHIIVRNFIVIGSWNDGFDSAGYGQHGLYQNCVALNSCGQGFSAHDATSVTYEDCAAVRCVASSVCNINLSRTVYKRCVFARNSWEAAVHFYDDADALFEECLIVDTCPAELVWLLDRSSAAFVDSILIGNPDANLFRMVAGSAALLNCTLLRARGVMNFNDSGISAGMSMRRSIVNQLSRYAVKFPANFYSRRFAFAENCYMPGLHHFRGDTLALEPTRFDRNSRIGLPQLGGRFKAELTGPRKWRSKRAGAILPVSVWRNYEKWSNAVVTPEGITFPEHAKQPLSSNREKRK